MVSCGDCQPTGKQPFDSTVKMAVFDDPKQGVAYSCNLIAALSSVAWVYWPAIKGVWDPCFWYKDNNGNWVLSEPNAVNDKFAFLNGELCNAKNGSADNGVWPAIYEKAWIKFRDTGRCDVSLATVDKWPQPIDALLALTGWGNRYFTKTPSSGTYAEIAKMCDSKGKIMFPMVAWTSPGSLSGYDQILSGHCYSVLGTYAAAGNYIVLRNPHGTYEGNLSSCQPAVLTASPYAGAGEIIGKTDTPVLPTSLPNQAYYKGSAAGQPVSEVQTNLKICKGIFAIRDDAFVKLFNGYAWVEY